MKLLDHTRSIDAYKPNHTAKVRNKFIPQGSILERLMNFAASVPDFRRSDKGNIRHRLDDIIIMILGRADTIEFGRYNLNKFRKMSMSKNGVPCAD